MHGFTDRRRRHQGQPGTKSLLAARTSLYGAAVLVGSAYSFMLVTDLTEPDPKSVVDLMGQGTVGASIAGASARGIEVTVELSPTTYTVRLTATDLLMDPDGALPVSLTLPSDGTCDSADGRETLTGPPFRFDGVIRMIDVDVSAGTSRTIPIRCHLALSAGVQSTNGVDSYYAFPHVAVRSDDESRYVTGTVVYRLLKPYTEEPVSLTPSPTAFGHDQYEWLPGMEPGSDIGGGTASISSYVPEARFRNPTAAEERQWKVFAVGLILALVGSLIYAIVDAWLVHRFGFSLQNRADGDHRDHAHEPTGTGWPP